jgi:hypothetical protein
MGKLLVVSQERQARTRMKIMEDEYGRKNRNAKYYEREKFEKGNGKYSEENTENNNNRRYRKQSGNGWWQKDKTSRLNNCSKKFLSSVHWKVGQQGKGPGNRTIIGEGNKRWIEARRSREGIGL